MYLMQMTRPASLRQVIPSQAAVRNQAALRQPVQAVARIAQAVVRIVLTAVQIVALTAARTALAVALTAQAVVLTAVLTRARLTELIQQRRAVQRL